MYVACILYRKTLSSSKWHGTSYSSCIANKYEPLIIVDAQMIDEIL